MLSYLARCFEPVGHDVSCSGAGAGYIRPAIADKVVFCVL